MWELVLEDSEIHTELEELSNKVEELEDALYELSGGITCTTGYQRT